MPMPAWSRISSSPSTNGRLEYSLKRNEFPLPDALDQRLQDKSIVVSDCIVNGFVNSVRTRLDLQREKS